MKYAIITCINSNYAVKAEYGALDKVSEESTKEGTAK